MVEDIRSEGGWSQPHLPEISARALVALYEGFEEANVLLDLLGASLGDIAAQIASAMVASGQLDSSLLEQAAQLIGSRAGTKAVVDSGATPPPFGQLDLSPDIDEEVFDLLIVHTDLVDRPALAFARLAEPLQLGCEKAAPVRFLFPTVRRSSVSSSHPEHAVPPRVVSCSYGPATHCPE